MNQRILLNKVVSNNSWVVLAHAYKQNAGNFRSWNRSQEAIEVKSLQDLFGGNLPNDGDVSAIALIDRTKFIQEVSKHSTSLSVSEIGTLIQVLINQDLDAILMILGSVVGDVDAHSGRYIASLLNIYFFTVGVSCSFEYTTYSGWNCE